ESTGALAGQNGETARNFVFGSVDFHYFVGSFDVDVHFAGAIHLAEFGARSHGECFEDFAGLGVDRSGVAARVVDGEDALALGVIPYSVPNLADGGLGALGQRLQVEKRDAVGLTIGDESFAQVVGDGNSVHAVQSGNRADDLAGIRIDHFHRAGVRDIE